MKKIIITLGLMLSATMAAFSENVTIKSPNGNLIVTVENTDGKAFYSVVLNNKQMLERSQLGLETNIGDFSKGLTMKGYEESKIDRHYVMTTTKCSSSHYQANRTDVKFETSKKQTFTITFNVSNTDIAFRYSFPNYEDQRTMMIKGETTSFKMPKETTTFICPQITANSGWMGTKPCYEEMYKFDAPMTDPSQYGEGYTFPCLFHIGDNGWVLISETGTTGKYVGCHLSDYNAETGYTIAFPMIGEDNGIGLNTAMIALPGNTPWRTITVGSDLKPIAETTIAYDVNEPLYEPSKTYEYGRYIWSWLMWQDSGTNYEDQIKFIDLAARMGYEFVLIDAFWDKNIGRDRMAELCRYAESKGVGLILWYSSNGTSSNPPQTPMHCLNTSLARNKELQWLKDTGIKGIKVDYFGGDKQHTMQYFEDILADANRYGIQVLFHGCTIPRGWEIMFPNYVSSEAMLSSENVYFADKNARREAMELSLHPFCRNAVATMDWGGIMLNKYMSRDNKSRHPRYTSDILELASGILTQSSWQCVALYPNTIDGVPQFELDFLKELPTLWDETRFIAGYPGEYVVLARRHNDKWYVVGINGLKKELKLELNLPMLAGKDLTYYYDKPAKDGQLPEPQYKAIKANEDGKIKVTIQPNGGIILK